MYEISDDHGTTVMVALDKAFETVNHGKLLNRTLYRVQATLSPKTVGRKPYKAGSNSLIFEDQVQKQDESSASCLFTLCVRV